MMGQVLQTIVLRGAEQRKHAQQVRRQIVDETILEQNVMGRLVSQPRQLMLPRPDQDHRQQRHRHVPPPAPAERGLNVKKP